MYKKQIIAYRRISKLSLLVISLTEYGDHTGVACSNSGWTGYKCFK